MGIVKRERNELGRVFRYAYTEQVIGRFDFQQFISKLECINAKKIALFCVEEKHEACHRSIVASKLNQLGFQITNL